MSASPHLKIKTQLYCGEEIAMGPGKAALLEAIVEHGSISAAGRALGMSYRRTWMLVDVMNRCWSGPLVETSAGGSHGGGAKLTALGEKLLHAFRALEAGIAEGAQGGALDALMGAILAAPRPSQKEE